MTINYLVRSDEIQLVKEGGASYRTFDAKPSDVQILINQAIHILDSFGIPVEDYKPRRLERTAIAFLALCNVTKPGTWRSASSLADDYTLKTRDVIAFINEHFGENISRGSYDDIRRKDLLHPRNAGIVVSSSPSAARNDPKRAWAISPTYIDLIRAYGSTDWEGQIRQFNQDKLLLRDQLKMERHIPKTPVTLPSGASIELDLGAHNNLQKAIIEEFLPRYGYNASVIYVGDASNKMLYYDRAAAESLGLLELAHGELPDVVAYSSNKNWLYLIEAVHSSGPMSRERVIALQKFLENCTAKILYLTAFLDRATFRKFVADIGWETEVWISAEPDHVIHFDGERFLGPYQ